MEQILHATSQFIPLRAKSVDAIVCSPPYANHRDYGNGVGKIKPAHYAEWLLPIAEEMFRVLRDDGIAAINLGDKVDGGEVSLYPLYALEALRSVGFKYIDRAFWNKQKYIPSSKRFGNNMEYVFFLAKSVKTHVRVWNVRTPYAAASLKRMNYPIVQHGHRLVTGPQRKQWRRDPNGALPGSLVTIPSETRRAISSHTAVYPVPFAEWMIRATSAIGNVVLDPFCGTGTTGVAARNLARHFIGIDFVYDSALVAKRRLDA